MLCAVVCKCDAVPSIGLGGQRLKQQCVSGRLKVADAMGGYRSPYKAEINYDMSRDPPAPIMDSGMPTKAHAYLPGWIRKHWAGGLGGYTPGIGNIRRPDVVIVNDASLAPIQGNIKSVVEIKFPPDRHSRKQQDAYARIAGSSNKVALMDPADCGCSDSERTESAQSTNRAALSEADDVFEQGAARSMLGVPPPMPPAPVPLP